MDKPIFLNRYVPVVTGTPQFPTGQVQKSAENQSESTSFQEILKQQLQQNTNLTFSKHAVSRVVERNIDVSQGNMERLNEGVKIAEEKGLNDTLILIDRTAFIVNVRNNTVITTVNEDDLKGNVFTNIDGTVII